MTKSSDTEEEIIFPQDWHDEPSLILAPYDALAAMLIWLGEMSKKPHSRGELPDPQISAEDRQRLLTAFLLLGKFDGMAGIPMFDRWMSVQGSRFFSRGEIFGELVDSDDVRRGPFAHYLDSVSGSSLLISTDAPLPTLEPEDIASLLPSAQKSMELAGYDLSREPSRDELEFDGNFATRKGAVGSASRILQNLERFRVAMNSKMIPIDFSTEGLAASGAISANRRAINSGYPLVSRFGAAPAWLALEYRLG